MFDADSQGLDSDERAPLTREEAEKLRETARCLSPWVVIGGQLAVGVLAALLALGVTQKLSVAQSVFYGALAVVIPAVLFARGITSKWSSTGPMAAVSSFFVWELIKMVLSVAMLLVAPRVIEDLSWPALLAGLVVTVKAVWLMVWGQARFGKLKKS